eukprot:TRINITY_DN4653_c0_g1_i1.p1 TRINITY_DN4653_c0_g1~~TRINITY_DN4653_c0_g1_i1.p1  ORF type:complete len:778 (+),score=179.35 TRINITY_DN4653_c0_g1_i1:53-2386(+)
MGSLLALLALLAAAQSAATGANSVVFGMASAIQNPLACIQTRDSGNIVVSASVTAQIVGPALVSPIIQSTGYGTHCLTVQTAVAGNYVVMWYLDAVQSANFSITIGSSSLPGVQYNATLVEFATDRTIVSGGGLSSTWRVRVFDFTGAPASAVLTATLASGQAVTTQVATESPGVFLLDLRGDSPLSVVGNYQIVVKVDGRTVPQCQTAVPVTVAAGPSLISATTSECPVSPGPAGEDAIVGEEVQLVFAFFDAAGNSASPPPNVTVQISGAGSVNATTVEDPLTHIWTVYWTVSEAGNYTTGLFSGSNDLLLGKVCTLRFSRPATSLTLIATSINLATQSWFRFQSSAGNVSVHRQAQQVSVSLGGSATVPVVVGYEGMGVYNATFSTTIAGPYTALLTVNNNPPSTLSFSIAAGAVDLAKTNVTCSSPTPTEGANSTVTWWFSDNFGNLIVSPPLSINSSVEFSSPYLVAHGSGFMNGTFFVTVGAFYAGSYNVTILSGTNEIGVCVFNYPGQAPLASLGVGAIQLLVTSPISLMLNFTDINGDPVTSSISGLTVIIPGISSVQLNQHPSGSYIVTFSTTVAQLWSVSVTAPGFSSSFSISSYPGAPVSSSIQLLCPPAVSPANTSSEMVFWFHDVYGNRATTPVTGLQIQTTTAALTIGTAVFSAGNYTIPVSASQAVANVTLRVGSVSVGWCAFVIGETPTVTRTRTASRTPSQSPVETESPTPAAAGSKGSGGDPLFIGVGVGVGSVLAGALGLLGYRTFAKKKPGKDTEMH